MWNCVDRIWVDRASYASSSSHSPAAAVRIPVQHGWAVRTAGSPTHVHLLPVLAAKHCGTGTRWHAGTCGLTAASVRAIAEPGGSPLMATADRFAVFAE